MKKMLLAAVLAAAGGAASAQGYAGALIGMSKFNVDCPGYGISCDDSDTGYKVYGGYAVSPNISIELGYTDFGKASLSDGGMNESIEAQAISLVGAFRTAFNADWTGVGRLGLASVKGKRATNFGSNASDSSIKFYAGVGLEYAVGAFKLTGALDLTTADIDDETGSVYLFGLGAQVGF